MYFPLYFPLYLPLYFPLYFPSYFPLPALTYSPRDSQVATNTPLVSHMHHKPTLGLDPLLFILQIYNTPTINTPTINTPTINTTTINTTTINTTTTTINTHKKYKVIGHIILIESYTPTIFT